MKNIPSFIICSLIYWLAYAKDYTFFVWVSWILIGFGIIGLFLEETKRLYEEYDVLTFLTGLPFAIFNLWVLWSYDESKIFAITYTFLSLICYQVLLYCKYNLKSSGS